MGSLRRLPLSLSRSLCYDFIMKVLGITAEYNPFHNGHGYHLRRSVEQTGADRVVVVMSGDFTQRGEAAVMDKWTRSRLAVENGADLVLELPFVFACSRGSIFASGAVDILKGAGVTDIAFGSETGQLEQLEELVTALDQRSREIDELRALEMKRGDSFVRAYRQAVARVIGEKTAALMDKPNNILAMEYLRRIRYWRGQGTTIQAHAVRRFGSGYGDVDRKEGFAGASALRKMMMAGDRELAADYVPDNVVSDLWAAEDPRRAEERAFLLLQSELMRNSAGQLAEIYCMGAVSYTHLERHRDGSGERREIRPGSAPSASWPCRQRQGKVLSLIHIYCGLAAFTAGRGRVGQYHVVILIFRNVHFVLIGP